MPIRVTYPLDGSSHFSTLEDNVRISLIHMCPFFGMLPRIPSLLICHSSSHQARQSKVKGLQGMRLMLLARRLLGRTALTALLYPVVGVYWPTAVRACKASQDWLARVRQQQLQAAKINSYQHLLRFGNAMLDKIASWRGGLRLGHDVLFVPGAEAALDIRDPCGKLLLASHPGDVEVCQALAETQGYKTINALVFSENAQRFKRIMQEMVLQAGINLMPVTNTGPETVILLKERLDNGEWVAIVGDRIAVNP